MLAAGQHQARRLGTWLGCLVIRSANVPSSCGLSRPSGAAEAVAKPARLGLQAKLTPRGRRSGGGCASGQSALGPQGQARLSGRGIRRGTARGTLPRKVAGATPSPRNTGNPDHTAAGPRRLAGGADGAQAASLQRPAPLPVHVARPRRAAGQGELREFNRRQPRHNCEARCQRRRSCCADGIVREVERRQPRH